MCKKGRKGICDRRFVPTISVLIQVPSNNWRQLVVPSEIKGNKRKYKKTFENLSALRAHIRLLLIPNNWLQTHSSKRNIQPGSHMIANDCCGSIWNPGDHTYGDGPIQMCCIRFLPIVWKTSLRYLLKNVSQGVPISKCLFSSNHNRRSSWRRFPNLPLNSALIISTWLTYMYVTLLLGGVEILLGYARASLEVICPRSRDRKSVV